MPVLTLDKEKYKHDPTCVFSIQPLQNQYRYYPLATTNEASSDLSRNSFQRCTRKGSFLYEETIANLESEPRLSFFANNFKSVFYKTQLKEQLLSEGIDFDGYKAGDVGDIDIRGIKRRFDICNNSNIYIHESDFPDYKLNSLKIYSSYKYDPDNNKLYCPKYYNCPNKDIETFKTYMIGSFLVDVNNHCNNPEYVSEHLDTRLSYEQVFQP